MGYGGYGMWAHGGPWFGGPMWFIGPIFGLLWLALLLGGVYFVVRSLRDRNHRGGQARDILDERYARSELSSEEYHERLQHMRQG